MEAKMKTISQTLKSIAKKVYSVNYHVCGYIYQNGILLIEDHISKNNIHTTINHIAEYDTKLDKRIARVVVHNSSILMIAPIERVEYYPNNNSESDDKHNARTRAIRIHFENGTELTFTEFSYDGDSFYHNSDIHIQTEDTYRHLNSEKFHNVILCKK
jgi:hypothetical protein